MKRLIIIYFFFGGVLGLKAQEVTYVIHEVNLPPELAVPQNEFSGLTIHHGHLVLLSESRVQEGQEGKIYLLKLGDLQHHLTDTSFNLPYQKINLIGLDVLVQKINGGAGNFYEGLEAIAIRDSLVYFSAETENPHPDNFLLRGIFTSSAVLLDTHYLFKLPKPKTAQGELIYNAGVEAMTFRGDSLYSFFEYNYFQHKNVTTVFYRDKNDQVPMTALPFRLTAITEDNQGFTGINYFYKGGGKDTIYRVTPADSINFALVHDASGWHNFCRLIHLDYHADSLVWKTIWVMPEAGHDYNWEGIARYQDGYFMVNDKYGPNNSRKSALIFLKPKE